jgi:hypothetical protein
MQKTLICMSTLLLSGILCRASDFPPKPEQQSAPAPQAQVPSLALSPAVIMVKASPSASSAHVLTITNLTNTRFRFVLEAFDVVIREGQRVFVPAGETEGGIARSAIFDPPAVDLNPGASAQVKVTLTVPLDPKVRAVAAIFHGLTALAGKGNLLFTGSLGTLITYNLSDKVDVRVGAPTVNPQTERSNLTISEQLENAGREPAVPKGTLAILRGTGELVGRVAIQPHRLLPGEKFNCAVEYSHNLRPGKYRAMVSFVHEGGLQTNSVEFQIQ